ncbi:NAD(P)H-quinone oxidoreductase [Corynebacterium glyciniphilum]|uniref:NAD(P)H-quinone oxidoreductase n=1 Tax=Corynebacterium glyciniphilum TaxID=1404244 RepID=UPI003DA08C44
MKAIWNNNLDLEDTAVPAPGPDEVLVKVTAAGVNRADVMQREGNYPPPPGVTDIIGMELSGVITELGDDVARQGRWAPGDEVAAIISGGGYAEYAVVPVGQLMPIPAGMTLLEAAALPETAATVWSNLVMEAGLTTGQTVLIHGGGSGIGTHAIQVAKAIGATVIVTVGSEGKAQRARELGADRVINYREQDFAEELENSVDVVLDIIAAKYLPGNVRVLAPGGTLVIIGMMSGTHGDLDIGALINKRARVIGTNVRRRPLTGPGSKATITDEVVKNVWPLVEDGTVKPVISATLPLAEARAAHEMLDSADSVGKVLLRP